MSQWDTSLGMLVESVLTKSDSRISMIPGQETWRLLATLPGAIVGTFISQTARNQGRPTIVNPNPDDTEAVPLSPQVMHGPAAACVRLRDKPPVAYIQASNETLGVPLLPSWARDTDGRMALGAAAPGLRELEDPLHPGRPYSGGYVPSRPQDEPAPDSLTYGQVRRALLRWHVANLEYGIAKSLNRVSLQVCRNYT
jgi:hypothetical protein